ncbi:MAG: N-acetylneuraminate synthase family protein, partial [Deltaproteobacteria bacterium]|nr:N-acetylneuraminate synthase family protein [Deltaproteobacteria bacterium]
CPDEGVGLNLMVQMRERYGLEVGLSDHTLEIFAPIAAVTLGARMIEKHFTFSRLMYGSDARHSLEPGDFAHMVKGIRAAERMRAPVDKDAVAAGLSEMKRIFEKSVVAAVDIPAGAVLSLEMLAVKKPGTGIPARRLASLVGRRTARAIVQDSLLSEEDLHA